MLVTPCSHLCEKQQQNIVNGFAALEVKFQADSSMDARRVAEVQDMSASLASLASRLDTTEKQQRQHNRETQEMLLKVTSSTRPKLRIPLMASRCIDADGHDPADGSGEQEQTDPQGNMSISHRAGTHGVLEFDIAEKA